MVQGRDELWLVGPHDEHTIFNVLQHCTNLKVLSLQYTPLLPPFPQPLSFPALIKLNVKNILEFPLQAAPNLRCLGVQTFWGDVRISHNPDIMQVLSGLRELFWDSGPDLSMLYTVGNGCLLESEMLEVIHVNWSSAVSEWIRFLTPSVSPLHRSPSVIGHQQAGSNPRLPFPGLKLFVIGPYSDGSEASLEPLRNLLQARPDLVSVYRDPRPPCAKRLSNLMPNRFITFDYYKADKLIEDLKRDLVYGSLFLI